MIPSEFARQPRGICLFDTWLRNSTVPTILGNLPVEILTAMDVLPSERMVSLATKLAAFAEANGDFLMDLIYAHYRYAEKHDWLSFWEVPEGLTRSKILGQVLSITLTIHDDDPETTATVFVNPRWDEEHKLDLLFEGTITKINDCAFQLQNSEIVFLE